MIQLSYNGELYSYDNKTSTTVSSTSSILVVLHPYVDIEGAKLFYSQEDTEGIVDITNNEAEIPGAYLVTGDLQVALKLASSEMSNTFTINVTKINSSGEVTDDDIQFTMDNKKRLILVPGSQGILAVQYDNRSEIVTFKFPRYQEEVDLSTKIPYVNYKRPQVEDLGRSLCTVEKTDDLFVYFSWLVDITATQYDGTIQFQVEFTDGENYRWQSQIGELPVLTSLYNTGLEPYEPDILEQYLQRINKLIQDGVGIPAGGEPDQVLAKKSGTDFDVEWRSSGVPSTELSEAGYVLTLFGLPSGKLVPTWLSNEYPVFFSFRLDNDGNVIQGPTWEEVLGVTFNKIVIAHVSTPNGAEVHRLLCTRRQDDNYYHPVTIRFSGMEGITIYSLSNGQTQDTWFFEEESVEGIASLQVENFSDEVIGNLSDLKTEDQSSIVAAINETIPTAHFSQFRKKNIAALPAPFEWYRGLLVDSDEPVELDSTLWTRGYISTQGRVGIDTTSAAYTGFVPAKTGMTIAAKERGYAWNCAMYSGEDENTFIERSATQYNDTPYSISRDCYIRFSIWKSDDSAEAVDVLSGKMDVSGITETVDAYTFGNASTTAAEVYAKFDALVTRHSDVLASNDLGAASDGSQMKEYVFTPLRPTYANVNPLPKILLICGLHGGEKSSIFGTYFLLKDMLESDSTPLDFLRTSVELHIIPVANPYGVDNSTRWNANHVDLNRNFNLPQWSYNSDTSSAYYAGESAGDQPETQILQDFIETNADAIFFIDFHTHGGQIVAQWDFVNWHSYPWTSDAFFNSFFDVSAEHISRVTRNFTKDYSLAPASGSIFGYIDAENVLACTDKYALSKNVAGMTFEGFNGFPSESAPYSKAEKKANSELIGNWIKEVVNAYGKAI